MGRYLCARPRSRRPVHWTYTRDRIDYMPAAIEDRYGDRYDFLNIEVLASEAVSSKDTKVDANGELKLSLDTPVDAGAPYIYTLEGEVTDVSRQKIAGRASFRVDPAPWYIGVKTPPYFADAGAGVDTDVIAVALDGPLVPHVSVTLALPEIQWNSVRRAAGAGSDTRGRER